jgi:hypothetical protein
MQRKHFNLAGPYQSFLRQCASQKLWIRTNRSWHGPYDWAYRFGVSYFGLDWEPVLEDPYLLISGAKATDLSLSQRAAVEKFEARVDAYYSSDKDLLLVKSIETGFWTY